MSALLRLTSQGSLKNLIFDHIKYLPLYIIDNIFIIFVELFLYKMKTKNEVLSIWIEQYSEPLLNRALYLLSDKEEAMDMVQEVFVAALDAYENFKTESSPLTWLYGILNHKCSDFYRKKYRTPSSVSLSHFFDENGSWIDHSVLNDWESSSEVLANDSAFNDTFDDCMEKLPKKWKIPLRLYYIQEKKNKEVCQELGLTATNLWKILQRGRLQLRECLEFNWFNNL
ncbi:RNA polymerase sigma-70 factor, ECF subfamily [Riemerella columbipharyngis]|uniref:RNA polymerase sigma-70 factor, ECF subfamily n=2 Tax=Riemerella columbipharyngis TaxID=1071918 RepID=A0A1G7BZY9_9FLAO|nr:RNA polymerase sigma-70 factor, ECF subfamily [Riemerella columbipharyngis]